MDHITRHIGIALGWLLLQSSATPALASDEGAQPRSGAATYGRPQRPLVPMRNIELMTQQAKEILAASMRAQASEIRVVSLTPEVWPDTGLGCRAALAPIARPTSGFRIALEYSGRVYTFSTDLQRVLACPPIVAQ